MALCNLNPDKEKECSCLILLRGKKVCDIFDEKISELKRCPLKGRVYHDLPRTKRL